LSIIGDSFLDSGRINDGIRARKDRDGKLAARFEAGFSLDKTT
jgi:hypothetical protein